MRLDTRGRNKKCEALNRGNPYDEVADCWVAKEKTCSVFKTVLYVVGGCFVGGVRNDFGCLSCLGAGLVDRSSPGTVCCCFFCFWGAC